MSPWQKATVGCIWFLAAVASIAYLSLVTGDVAGEDCREACALTRHRAQFTSGSVRAGDSCLCIDDDGARYSPYEASAPPKGGE